MKLFLLDAYALIYRAYYAMIKSPRITSKGVNVSAIQGFVNTLEEVLKREDPTHIAVAFDPSGPTFRHEIFEAYKAHREETPEVIRESVPVIKDIIRAYRIPILEVPGYEADDVIGTVAKMFADQYQVFIMTLDKDFGQLVDNNIFIYRPRYGSNEIDILDEERVKSKYGLTDTTQMIDLLGLMGDAADNIPGCPGVGEITARKLISEFGSIDNLLSHTGQLKGSLQQKIVQNRETILFSRMLATIKTDVPVHIQSEELLRKEIDEPALRAIFEELEFRQLLTRVLKVNIKEKTKPAAAGPSLQFSLFDQPEGAIPLIGDLFSSGVSLKSTRHNYLVLKDEDIPALIARIRQNGSFALDTETTSINPLAAKLVGISFSLKEYEAYFLPVSDNDQEVRQALLPFKELLESPDILKIGQNLKYDINVLKKYDIRVNGPLFDTMIAHYLINPEYRHNLDYLAETYLNYTTIPIEDLIGKKGEQQISMRNVPLAAIVDYACEDVDITLRLKNIFERMIHEGPSSQLFYQVEMPLAPVLADMEEAGVRLDINALKESSTALTTYLKEVEEDVFKLTGKAFNISSPKVVGEVLFDHLKVVEKPRKTKSGQYVTSEEVLESIKGKHPVISKILDFRKIKKLLTTYVDTLPTLVSPADGKIHTTFNQATTITGRLSSTNPNMQNIPIRHEEGKEIRRAFIPDPDCLFLAVDYSQIELRIMAHFSRDENMMEAFRNGQDIHAATAALIFGLPLDQVDGNMRRKAKTANFGVIYGISTFGLAEQLHIPRSEAKEFIDGYFLSFPDVKAYIDQSIAVARKQGYVETLFGRRRLLPDINSHNSVVRGYAERNAVNTPIQGSAADIIKVAMNRIQGRFREEKLRSRMIMQVHDELDFNVFPEELEEVKRIAVYEMEHAVELGVPLIAACGVGGNWLEAH
jgi:DNA polymerase-1